MELDIAEVADHIANHLQDTLKLRKTRTASRPSIFLATLQWYSKEEPPRSPVFKLSSHDYSIIFLRFVKLPRILKILKYSIIQ